MNADYRMFQWISLVLLGVLSAPLPAAAFELAAHSRLTYHAVLRSELAQHPSLLASLGLDDYVSDLGKLYFDFASGGASVYERSAHRFDSEEPLGIGANPYAVLSWLIRGAIREDDLTLAGCIGATVANAVHLRSTECNPRGPDGGDPHGDFDRVLHHFYDPHFKRGFLGGEKAIDWATGSIDALTSPNHPYLVSRNHFSLMSAREAMYRALTGRRSSDRQPLEPLPDGKATTPEQIRNAYWATTFRALGDAVHLVQDMAQPQHTRNDAHPGSVFEGWIDARALGASVYSLSTGVQTAPPLDYGNHPIPRFDRYSAYWSTGASGLGLADYSNRGFFTEDSNFGSAEALQYPSPPSVANLYQKEDAPTSVGTALAAEVRYLRGPVHDFQTGTTESIRMTTESVFDAWAGLGIVPIDSQFTMNRAVYDDQARLLVPRAVAYSAGLIDYFFRGRIDFHPDPEQPSTWVIRNLGTEAMKGGFSLHYDGVDGKRHPVPGTMPDQTWVYLEVPAAGKVDGLTFTAPTDPAPRFPGEYMLVFNGEMGNEAPDAGNVGAVVGKYLSGGDLIVSALRPSGTAFDLYRSTDLGNTWTKAGAAAAGPNFLRYLGDGAVLSESVISLDAGANWIDVRASGLQSAALRRDAAPAGGANLISTYEEQVPKSVDAPTGWQAMIARSDDHGVTWSAGQPIPGIERRLHSPAPLGEGRYVAMSRRYVRSEACPFGICNYYEAVLLQTHDAGANWEEAALIDLDHVVHLGRHSMVAGKLVADPLGEPVLLGNRYLPSGASRHEFVRSLDGGLSWTAVGFPAEVQYGAPDYYTLWQLTVVGKGVILAYFHDNAGTNRHVLFKSVDAGETWERAGNLPANTVDPGLFGMAFIPLARTLPAVDVALQ